MFFFMPEPHIHDAKKCEWKTNKKLFYNLDLWAQQLPSEFLFVFKVKRCFSPAFEGVSGGD